MRKITKPYYFFIKFLVYVWLFLLPFIFWPQARVPYEIPRVWFVEYGAVLIFLVSMKSKTQVHRGLFVSLLLFTSWVSLTSLLGVDFFKSLQGNYYRLDGLVTLISLVLGSIGLARVMPHLSQSHLIKTLSGGSIVVSVLTVCQQLFPQSFTFLSFWADGNLGATFGQPNFLAGYLAVSMPAILYSMQTLKVRKVRWFYLLSLVLVWIALYLTGSMGGIITALIALVLWLAQQANPKIRGALGLLGGIILIVLGSLYYQNLKLNTEADNRLRIVHQLMTAVSYRPIQGWGWANVDYAFESNSWPIKFQYDVYVDKAHSTLLEVLVTTGIPGLILYLVLVGQIIKNLYPKSHSDPIYKIWLIILILYLFHSQTNVISIGEEVMFWLVLGLCLASETKSASRI